MRIAFVTQWYDPEGGSAAIPGAMVRSLIGRGHQVQVLTGFPNYPHGSLYEGYRVRPRLREHVRGVPVTRVALYPSHDRNPVRRIANFVSFAASASTLGAWSVRDADVALVYSTPATVGLAGLVLRHLVRRPFVLYVQDLWPDTVIATGMLPARGNGPAQRVLERFCNRVYASAAGIAVISPGMKDRLVERGVPAEKVDVIWNWVDEDAFAPLPPQTARTRFDLMYAGNLGDVQGLDTAVRAVALCGDDVHLRLIGSGVAAESLARLATELGVRDRVHFEGTRSIHEMSAVMSRAHAQLVCLRDDPLFRITMPSKVQAILASGRPLITSAPGDAGALCEQSGAGVATVAGDPESLATGIRRLAAMSDDEREALGRQGRAFYEQYLSAAVGSAALERALARAWEQEPCRAVANG